MELAPYRLFSYDGFISPTFSRRGRDLTCFNIASADIPRQPNASDILDCMISVGRATAAKIEKEKTLHLAFGLTLIMPAKNMYMKASTSPIGSTGKTAIRTPNEVAMHFPPFRLLNTPSACPRTGATITAENARSLNPTKLKTAKTGRNPFAISHSRQSSPIGIPQCTKTFEAPGLPSKGKQGGNFVFKMENVHARKPHSHNAKRDV